jgi:hypothetical protein
VKEIEEICGAPIPYEESLANDAGALNFIDKVSCCANEEATATFEAWPLGADLKQKP